MKENLSIIARLKKIAITSLDLGREIAKDKASHVSQSLRDSRAGHLYSSTRQRVDQALGRAEAEIRKRSGALTAKTQDSEAGSKLPSTRKHHLGAKKYSAKTARLAPH